MSLTRLSLPFQSPSVGKLQPPPGPIRGHGGTDSHGDVALPTEDRAQRRTNLLGGKIAGCHLVEQGLEGLKVVAIQERDLDGGSAQRVRSAETREAAAEHYHARRGGLSVRRCGGVHRHALPRPVSPLDTRSLTGDGGRVAPWICGPP